MSIKKYMQDHWPLCLMITTFFLLMTGLFVLFDVNRQLIIIFVVMFGLMIVTGFLWDLMRKKHFYDEMASNLKYLDQKYLILEMLQEPSFYEGSLFWQMIYECNKSMCENVNQYRSSVEDFKSYIEAWVHEVKLPIASLELMMHNRHDEMEAKYKEQLRRMDQYTDQVLYYVRSEHTENDFLLKQTDLSKVITKVALKYREDLLLRKIDLRVEGVDLPVLTDAKWLEFILGQIVWNSIKYKAEREDSFIRLSAEDKENTTVLNIYDNGIGIPASDIDSVFKKSFTGENGRNYAKSTGMGLYIVKRLCDNLGHQVAIQSEQGSYTNVQITFAKNDYYLRSQGKQ